MSDDKKQSIQMDILDDIMDNITNLYKCCISLEERIGNLYKYCISLEERIGNLEVDTRHDRLKEIHEKIDDMESDVTHLFHLTHGGDNFCGNCAHCTIFPDGIYRCDITEVETDPDNSSCIRFESPQKKFDESDAEICKGCLDKGTPRCYKCSHFPF